MLASISFQVFISIFDRISEIDRSSAPFRFLILIYFTDYSSESKFSPDANFSSLCRRLQTRFLSLPAKHRLCSAAAATRQRCLGCESESAVVPAALPPSLHLGSNQTICHSGGNQTIVFTAYHHLLYSIISPFAI